MSSSLSQKDIAKSVKTLLVLLQSLRGQSIIINLRDDSVVQGTVERVDGHMNIELANASVARDTFYDTVSSSPKDQCEDMKHYNYYFVKGPRIRHIELPENCDDFKHIKDEINRIRNRRLQWTKKNVIVSSKPSMSETNA